jgi:peptidoglycan/xylan/chitin deacetylase (PgdA/CDA1 family)
MKRLGFVAWMLVCVLAFSASAQIVSVQVYGWDTHPRVIFPTFDDLMDEFGPDGSNQTLSVKYILDNQGLPGAFFMVGCHIYGQGYSEAGSALCVGLGDVSFAALKQLVDAGFLVGNHSFSHIPFNLLNDGQIVWEVRTTKVLTDSLGQTLGLNLLRCPGLACGNAMVALNAQPDLAGFKGPISADVGGGFFTDDIGVVPGFPGGSQVGGDWWFYDNNMPPELAGYYYIRDITNNGGYHGLIVLLHTRTSVMTGRDGSRQFPAKLLRYILANLPEGFTFAPMDGIPGLLGNIQTTPPEKVSEEFGSSDGQGRVIAGNITGSGKTSLCKARDNSVRCIVRKNNSLLRRPEVRPSFEVSYPWYEVSDPDWSAKYGSQFWLVDIDHDGRADLVLPSQAGLLVGYSNGSGFSSPVPLLTKASLNFQGVRFADVNGDGLPDVVEWTPAAVRVYINNGRGFNPPVSGSTDFLEAQGWGNNRYLSTMQLVDVDGDGCADLLIRGAADVMVGISNCDGTFKPAKSWTKRFSDRQNFSLDSQNQTFSVARIAGKLGLAAGLFTGGVVFQEADSPNNRFSQYRYIMDNHGFSGDPGFHPDAYASDVIFTDLYGDGDTVPVQVRLDGLHASRVNIIR